jgi:hypothetical protein
MGVLYVAAVKAADVPGGHRDAPHVIKRKIAAVTAVTTAMPGLLALMGTADPAGETVWNHIGVSAKAVAMATAGPLLLNIFLFAGRVSFAAMRAFCVVCVCFRYGVLVCVGSVLRGIDCFGFFVVSCGC